MTPTPEQYDAQLQQSLRARDFARAKAIAEVIVQDRPTEPRALNALAEISLLQGLWDDAAAYADRAAAAAPGDVRALLLQARVALARGDGQGAIERCDQALALRPGDANALLLKATTLERRGDWESAMQTLAPLTAPSGGTPPVVHAWALCLVRSGDLRGAIDAIDRSLGTFFVADATSRLMRARLLFVKAKAHDRLGEYDAAFAAAAEAKKLTAAPFNPADFVARTDRLIAAFTPERLASLPRATPTAARHVFIAGMPRSGTTLVEQIIDAHPDATGIGEMKELDIFVSRLPSLIGSPRPYPDCVQDLKPEHVESLRADYERAIARHGFPAAPVYVNKHLDNAAHLGLIRLLFPEARVIVTRRDPRDVAVSCMMSPFRPERYPELSTVEHTGLAYAQWERLIAHFTGILDLPVLEVRYEELVHEQDRLSRAIVEFCGLPWDDRCARFYQSGRTVMTLSYDQVSRPIYDSSIGRWKNYERHLGSLAV